MMDPVAAAVEQAEIQATAAVEIAEAQAEAAVAVAEAEAEADKAEAEALAEVDTGADLRAEIEQLGRRVDMHDRWLMVHEDRHSAEYAQETSRAPEAEAPQDHEVPAASDETVAGASEPVAEIAVPEPEPEAPAERHAHRQPSHRGATTHYAAMRERHGLR